MQRVNWCGVMWRVRWQGGALQCMRQAWLIAVWCILVGVVMGGLAGAVWANSFSNLFVFGDSISDAGNAFVATGGAVPVSPPYFQGRFSNGKTYVEGLATKLGLDASAALLGGTNFAVGGETTAEIVGRANAFLTLTGHAVDAHALYVVFGGANDLIDVLLGLAPPTDTSAEVTNIRTIITGLAMAGADNFLVPNLPNLGHTPGIMTLDTIIPGLGSTATGLSHLFNSNLAVTLDSLESSLGIHIHRLDTFTFLEQAIADPGRFGFTNVTDACLQGMPFLEPFQGGVPCATPDTFLFWDSIHPTGVSHAILAEAAFRAVVPEPSTLLMLSIGLLGVFGYGLWRRVA